MNEDETRRRWINFGELIALAALIVSALGVWIAWKSSNQDRSARIIEQRSAIPLSLRATVDRDGKALTIMPADPSHGLESLTIAMKGASPIEIGSDGRLYASDIAAALKEHDKEEKGVTYSIPVRINARYVEAGTDRRGGGNYLLRYKWEGGGLFGSRSMHLLSLSKG
jgi:hypothetical protein